MLLTLGLGLLFAPISVAAYKYIPARLRAGPAVGLASLLPHRGRQRRRTSLASTIQERREQFHVARLGEHLHPFNPHVTSFMDQARPFFFQQTGDAAASQQMAVQGLDNLRQQQAAALAYLDVFWVTGVLAAVLVVLVLLMKRSVAEKGEHVGAE